MALRLTWASAGTGVDQMSGIRNQRILAALRASGRAPSPAPAGAPSPAERGRGKQAPVLCLKGGDP
jgi:hypothetical protein